jgi:hypothetical protein
MNVTTVPSGQMKSETTSGVVKGAYFYLHSEKGMFFHFFSFFFGAASWDAGRIASVLLMV